MIILKRIDKSEYKEAALVLKEENMQDSLTEGIIYTLKKNHSILGIGKVRLKHDYSILDYIVIKKGFRGHDLGDALLRVLAYKMKIKEIKKLLYPYDNTYLIKKGFKDCDKNHINPYRLCLNISAFFDKKCYGDKNGF